MVVVFHGQTASAFSEGFAGFVHDAHDITVLSGPLTRGADRRAYASADVIVSFEFDARVPRPERLKLFQVPGAGYDAIDLEAVPHSAVVCNCYGHEQAIAEYTMAALLMRQVPLAAADERLRGGDWAYRFRHSEAIHDELADKTIGLLGFGHIGRAIAARAKAFEMRVHVANRSPVPASALVDRSFGLHALAAFWPSADFFVVTLPLAAETLGIVGAAAFTAMRPTAVLVNVGRGLTVDERALFDALKNGRIAGAVIDTWYNYPSSASPKVYPSALPFHELSNVVMTPHMSGWTPGTIRRRQRTIADNVDRLMRGDVCINIVRPARFDRT